MTERWYDQCLSVSEGKVSRRWSQALPNGAQQQAAVCFLTRGNREKVEQRKFYLNTRKNFTVWVAKHWNRLHGKVAELFSGNMQKLWTHSWVMCCGGPCWSREVGLDNLQWSVPTLPNLWFSSSNIGHWIQSAITTQIQLVTHGKQDCNFQKFVSHWTLNYAGTFTFICFF